MINAKHKWYTPVFLFAWASGWIYFGIQLLSGEDVWFAWYRGAPRTLLRRDTHPYLFWECVGIAFVFAVVGLWASVVHLRKYLRERRDYSATTMQDLQRHMISKR